ncbi:MAG: hypothetical protein KatS3mg003_0722 [Candidatus Nitrosocaldaceae archaeon]|nr:MAG: hypothetical protein KatS3mg003_0722 [Candidatus Nitrosocaldaceae archaeon]
MELLDDEELPKSFRAAIAYNIANNKFDQNIANIFANTIKSMKGYKEGSIRLANNISANYGEHILLIVRDREYAIAITRRIVESNKDNLEIVIVADDLYKQYIDYRCYIANISDIVDNTAYYKIVEYCKPLLKNKPVLGITLSSSMILSLLKSDWSSYIDLEERSNGIIHELPVIWVCIYNIIELFDDIDRFAEIIAKASLAHDKVILIDYDNTYYNGDAIARLYELISIIN